MPTAITRSRFRLWSQLLVLSLLVLSPATLFAAEKMSRWNIRPTDGTVTPTLPPPQLQQLQWIPNPDGPQVPINNADVQIFPSADPQTEVSIALNPANPMNLLVTSNTTPTSTGQGYWYSFDGGATWAGSNSFPNGSANFGDPVSVFDGAGTAYDVTLRSPAGIGRTSSLDGGITWGPFINIDPTNSSGCDKEMAWADQTPGSPFLNTFYCAWTDFNLAPRVVLTTSTDGFSAHHILDGALGGDFGQGVNVKVGENGQAYVCWAVYTGGFLPETGMGFTKSLDGGLTWSPATIIFPYTGIRASNGPNALFNNTRVNSFPAMAVDISNGANQGRIYITYADRSTGDSDIYCRYSDNEGATWSAAVRVNSEPVSNGQQQWFPWAACDPVTGELSIVYYNMDQPAGFLTKAWIGHSTDGGNTFETFAVSDVHFTPTALPAPFAGGYQGDYIGIIAHNGRAFPAWCDNRTGQYNNYVENVVYADPTDPNAPSNASASSDCNAPTEIELNWTDPTTHVDGSALGDFEIEISRNGSPLTTVDQGIETFTDTGLTTGTLYTYDLRTHDQDNDSLSIVVTVNKYAGGDPTPAPPSSFSATALPGPNFQLDWTNPNTNVDGSVLCDFAGVQVYRNNALLATLNRVTGDAGMPDTYTDTAPVPGLNCYKLKAFDSEIPSKESAFTAEICLEVPLNPPFCDDFPASGAPDGGKWTTGGVVVDNLASNPPTPPFAADFLAAVNLTSRPIDLNGLGGQNYTLVYAKEQTGNGESPDASNDLILEFLNSDGVWDEVDRHLGSDPDETNFTNHVVGLDVAVPSTGTFFHSQFKLRFRSTGDAGSDNWFVDSICLDIPNCSPTITVAPVSVDDTLVAGTPAGDNDPVTVSNSCAFDVLTWSAAENPDETWLTLSGAGGAIGGIGSQMFVAKFNAIGMSPGVYSTDIEVTSNDPVNPFIVVTATLTVTDAPDIDVSPTSISNSVPQASPPIMDVVTISNLGTGPLEWSLFDAAAGSTALKGSIIAQGADGRLGGLSADAIRTPSAIKAVWYASPNFASADAAVARVDLNLLDKEPGERKRSRDVFKSLGDTGADRHYPPQPYASGGPDAAGYRFIDSDEAGGPVFSWFDISGIGTPSGVVGDDVNQGPFPLGFSFAHYGNSFASVRICSNGFLSFTSTSNALTNAAIPAAAVPNDLVAPYWDDLDPSEAGTIYTYQDVPNNRFIVQWDGVPHFSAAGGEPPNTFQVIINQNGSILYQYLDIGAPANSATVGVENAAGNIGLQAAFNQAYVHNALAVLIYQDSPWLSAAPTSGTVAPGGSTMITVTSDPTGLVPGTYFGNVIINSNDPATPASSVHVTLDITGSGVALPFCDQFNDGTGLPNPANWTNSGVTLDGVGLNEPSLPFSARFNGPATITSVQIDTDGLSGTGQKLFYYWEETGGGEPPDAANDLIVEFKNSNGVWDEVVRHLGSMASMSNYALQLVDLDALVPSSGTYFYPLFQMRIRSTGDALSDDWFVDDLCLQEASCDPTIAVNPTALCDTLVANTIGTPKDVVVSNSCAFDVLSFSILESPDVTWLDVTPTNGVISGIGNATLSFAFNATGVLPGTFNTTVHVLSNDPANPDVPVSVCLVVTGAPHAVITPDSLCVVTGFVGGPIVHANVTIANTGTVPLTWRLSDTQGIPAAPGELNPLGRGFSSPEPNAKKLELFKEYVDLKEPAPEAGVTVDLDAKGAEAPFRGGLQPYGQGGPDAFGYRWIDSDQAGGPPFEWIELQGNGGIDTGLHADDVTTAPIPLGFDMPFYGTNFNAIRVCSNGWMSFTSTATAFTNTALPNTAQPNNTIAPLWDDYDMRNNVGTCYYRSDPALGRFIVEWKKVTRFNALTDTLTFEAILCQDGSIRYNYLSVKGILNSNTIGIENAAGTTGLQVVFNANYVHNNLAVLIQNEQEWLSATPTSGTVNPGGSQNVDVALDPTGVPLGMHTGWLRINTNDPLVPKKALHVCFNIEEPIAVALSRFEALSTPDGVAIEWATASEEDHSHFDVLKSTAGGSFSKVNTSPVTGDGTYQFVDSGVTDGVTYGYMLEAVDRSGGRQQFGPVTVTYAGRPAEFSLAQNFPNPFSSRTAFRLDLPQSGDVSVRVYSASGQLVRTIVNGPLAGGRYDYEWDGRDEAGTRSAQGFYFLRAETSKESKTVRMILAR